MERCKYRRSRFAGLVRLEDGLRIDGQDNGTIVLNVCEPLILSGLLVDEIHDTVRWVRSSVELEHAIKKTWLVGVGLTVLLDFNNGRLLEEGVFVVVVD